MPRQTQRGAAPQERLFDYPADRPKLFGTTDRRAPEARQSGLTEATRAHGLASDRSGNEPEWHDRTLVDPGGTVHPTTTSHHQLPMFMSAREIQHQYQPLEGDRQESYDWREGEPTGRPQNTAGQTNEPIGSNDKQWARRRVGYESGVTTHYRTSHSETDEQVWGRKLDEAMMPHYEYREVHQGFGATGSARTPGYDTLMARSSAQERHPFPGSSAGTNTWEQHQMDVDEYVGRRQEEHRWDRESADQDSLHDRLWRAMQPGGEGYTSVVHLGTGGPHGSSDKPMVYGAHHRIAAMADISPDRLLPVLHHRQFSEARSTTGKQNPTWKYS